MPRTTPHLGRLGLLGLLVPALLLVVASAPAHASPEQPTAEHPVRLRAAPVDQPGAWFDVTVRPGEHVDLAIELSNDGEAAIEARTYAADVDTVADGGFGAALVGSAPTGATTWLDYAPATMLLPAGGGRTEHFTVTVPADAPAGEHITSIVLENAVPVRGTGSVAMDQTVRQAVAVSIKVPGLAAPALTVGAATHAVVAGSSVVAVAVDNPGNARLQPSGTFVLHDASGEVVARAPVVMGSFYAWTDTEVRFPIGEELDAGRYTVDLDLEDTISGITASATQVPLVVPDAPLRRVRVSHRQPLRPWGTSPPARRRGCSCSGGPASAC